MVPTDVAIIGSGIGGMTAARLLAKQGLKVHLIEQHTTPGGMTHEFSRPGGWIFSTGLHYLGRDRRGSWLPLFTFLTDGRVRCSSLPDEYDSICLPGLRFAIPSGEAALKQRLAERFPDEVPAIEVYFRDLRRAVATMFIPAVAGTFSAQLAQVLARAHAALFPIAHLRTLDYLRSRFRNPSLIALLCGQWADIASPQDSAFGYHATLVSHYFEGALYPLGGTRSIVTATLAGLRRDGGEVSVGHRVEQIVMTQGRAEGLRIRDHKSGELSELTAGWIISDAGVRNTFGVLLPPSQRAGYASPLSGLADNFSGVCAFIRMKSSPAQLGATGANLWLADSLDPTATLAQQPGNGQLFVSFPSLKDRRQRHTIEVLSPCLPDAFGAWEDQAWPRRSVDYLALKAGIAERIVTRLETALPGFRAAMDGIEIATPLSFAHFQGSRRGSFYGIQPTPEKALARLTRVRTPVPRLLLTGQDVLMPGIVPSMIAGALAAASVLGLRKGSRMLGRAMRGGPL